MSGLFLISDGSYSDDSIETQKVMIVSDPNIIDEAVRMFAANMGISRDEVAVQELGVPLNHPGDV